jgi:hypothetical protein
MKFEELRLTYGYPLQLQSVSSGGQPERLSCRLIGCLPGRSILLSIPKQGGKLVKFRVGQKIVVRLMIGNGIGIFAALVESQTLEPYPILHLSYPEAVTFKGIRSETRVAVREQISLSNISAESKSVAAGLLADISVKGARVELMEDFAEIGNCLELKAQIEIRDVKRELIIKGVVCSRIDPTDNISDGALVSYGMEFIEQPDEQRLVLYAYIFNQMILQESSVG